MYFTVGRHAHGMSDCGPSRRSAVSPNLVAIGVCGHWPRGPRAYLGCSQYRRDRDIPLRTDRLQHFLFRGAIKKTQAFY
jgi:hypothetical protein